MTHKKIHNIETGEVIEREMNAEELTQREADQAQEQTRQEAEAALVANRSALLQRLGISEEEAQILLS